VEKNRTTSHVRLVVAPGAVLSGRVIDAATRAPIANASINFDALTLSGLGSGGFVSTDANGAYTLPGAPPGPFSIRVAHPLYTGKVVSGLVTRGAPALTQDVELAAADGGAGRDEIVGIGTLLVNSTKGVEIGPLVDGGPAESAGLRKGDRLVRIDGEDATTFPLADCMQRLRGVEGSIVRLQVEREGRLLDFRIVRRVIQR
jgi:membrane-associated protease RseP (regulator of RpoE activity)